MAGEIIRQYRIIKELNPGSGAMGDVFLAEHVFLPKRYAIKRLKPQLSGHSQFHQRFFREAYEQSLLKHANIVQSIDFFEEGGHAYFVMEYVAGPNLNELIDKKGRLPETEALSILTGVLEGLQHAHGKQIIHRDIKPSNILIDEDGTPRIADFGIALLQGGERLTETGMSLGTSCYMSPEQIQHPKSIDKRCDIYAAGILLYEMLTGDVPYDGETDFSIKQQHVFSGIPNPRLKNASIKEEVADIIRTAMAKNPDDRFQNCAEFLARIKAYQNLQQQKNWLRLTFISRLLTGKNRWLWLGVPAAAVLFYLAYSRWPDVSGGSFFGRFWHEQPPLSQKLTDNAQAKAESGDITAQRTLGLNYLKGVGVPRNNALALAWLTKAAEAGDSVAQYEIGELYDYGNGVGRDPSKAGSWYLKSAEQGYAKAQNSLGDLFYNGEGLPADHQRAYDWYKKAALQGNKEAQNNLGEMLLQGDGTPLNIAEGVNWIRQSAEQGYERAQKNLGDLFLEGKGVEKNFAQAVIWYQRAAVQGNEEAKAILKKTESN